MIQDKTKDTNTRHMEKEVFGVENPNSILLSFFICIITIPDINFTIFATNSITILVINIITILDILDILNILNILNTINMLLIIRWCSSVQPVFSCPGSMLGTGTKSESGKMSSLFFVFLSTWCLQFGQPRGDYSSPYTPSSSVHQKMSPHFEFSPESQEQARNLEMKTTVTRIVRLWLSKTLKHEVVILDEKLVWNIYRSVLSAELEWPRDKIWIIFLPNCKLVFMEIMSTNPLFYHHCFCLMPA